MSIAFKEALGQSVYSAVEGAKRPFLSSFAGVAATALYFPSDAELKATRILGGPVKPSKTQLELEETTPFTIGSVSKVFTSAMILAHTDLKQRQTPIGDLVDDLPPAIGALTLESLITFRSGLPEDNQVATDLPPHQRYPYTVEDMKAFLKDYHPTLHPGKYAYSNLGFALASLGIPGLLGSSDSLESLILSQLQSPPLNMQSTTYFEPGMESELTPHGTWPAYNGAGGMVSTLADMRRWLRFMMGRSAPNSLSSALPALQKSVHGPVGYGWHFFCGFLPDGTPNISQAKGGDIPGTSAWIQFSLDPLVGVVVLNCPLEAGIGRAVFDALVPQLPDVG